MTKLIVMRRAGGGKVAINLDLVTHVRSAAGSYTDIFVGGQQVAVEGVFEEVVARVAGREARPTESERREDDGERRDPGLVFGRVGR